LEISNLVRCGFSLVIGPTEHWSKDSDFEPATGDFRTELSPGYLRGFGVESDALYANDDLNSFGAREMPCLLPQ